MINIYGIYHGDLLLYIGSTGQNPVKLRWRQHELALKKGQHSNKTLQKYYIKNGLGIEDLRFECLYSKDTDNTLIKFMLEMACISVCEPSTNGCVIKSGRTVTRFKKMDKDIANGVIDSIMRDSIQE